MDTPPDVKNLQLALQRIALRIDARAGTVATPVRLSGGASKEIWSFDIQVGDAAVGFILRRAPAAGDAGGFALEIEAEAEILGLVAGHGVPVPAVRYVLRPEDELGRGFVMDRIDGETLGRRIIRDEKYAVARAGFARQAGEILARLHATDTARADLPVSPAAAQVADLASRYRQVGWPRPVFELAFRWLQAHTPPAPPIPRLVHGDFRNGNLMFGPTGVRAVLDWEMVHLGDPMEDLGWLCVNSWRFGETGRPVGGIGRREDLYASYEAQSGVKVDPATAHFWEVLGTLRWGVMCAGMIDWIRGGEDRSVERVVIARRASETELDLLNLLAPRA